MPLDRQSIEKRDFPINRRGYDPDAVDAHLAQLADEVDELKVSSHRRSETLASTAGEQVRAIVEAAEASAVEIESQAQAEARTIRAEAASDAHATRDGAVSQAHEYVGRVSEATAAMLQRLNAMESELTTLIDSLRTGANRLNADLQLLEGSFDEVRSSASPRGREEPDPSVAGPLTGDVAEPVSGPSSPEAAGEAAASRPYEQPSPELEEAKLIVLDMALGGTSREEAERYLAENFAALDRVALLDDVYSSVDS